MKIFKTIKRSFVFSKVSFVRAGGYIHVVMMAVIFVKQFDVPLKWYPLWFAAIYIIMWIVGYIDYRFGLHSDELGEYFTRNPIIKEILKRLENIEKKLDK